MNSSLEYLLNQVAREAIGRLSRQRGYRASQRRRERLWGDFVAVE